MWVDLYFYSATVKYIRLQIKCLVSVDRDTNMDPIIFV